MVRLRKSTRCASFLSLDRIPKRKRQVGSLKSSKKKPKLALKPAPGASGSNSHAAKPRGRPRKKPRGVAAPQNVPSSVGDQATANDDASVVMVFAEVVVEVPTLPIEEIQAAPTEHTAGGKEATPLETHQANNGEVDEGKADSPSAAADHNEGVAATTAESQSSPASEIQRSSVKRRGRPKKRVSCVHAKEATPPKADKDNNGEVNGDKAAEAGENFSSTTTEDPSSSASAIQRTCEKRRGRGRPKKRRAAAAPEQEAPKEAKNDSSAKADRVSSGEVNEDKADSSSAEADHSEGSAATTTEGPSSSASDIQCIYEKRSTRSARAAALLETSKLATNVLPHKAVRDESESDEDTSVMMDTVEDLVNVLSLGAEKRGDGRADASRKAPQGVGAEAKEGEADRSPAEAGRIGEAAAPTEDDSTASTTPTDNSAGLGPSDDSEQSSEPDARTASSLPADSLSVADIVDDDASGLAGLCSQMAVAEKEVSRDKQESSAPIEASSDPDPASAAVMTSSRLYNLIVPNDPDDLRLASMCSLMDVTDEQNTAGNDGQTESSDDNAPEAMHTAENAEDAASSTDVFEDALSRRQEQPDTVPVSTEADASSGGELPGSPRCPAHLLEIEALRETNEQYHAERTDLQAQLQAKTEELCQLRAESVELTERLEALQLRKDQELAAVREQYEKRLRELQQGADALTQLKDSEVIRWQQHSHDVEEKCQQLKGDLARAQQAVRDAAEKNAQLAQRCSQLEAAERSKLTEHNPRFCMATSVSIEQLSQCCKQLEESEKSLREQLHHKSSKLHEVSSRLQKCLEEVERVRSLEVEKDQAVQEAERLQTLRTESKNQISKLNALARRRRLRLERTKAVIKRMKASLRREKHRRKNRESLLEVKREPSVTATDCAHRPSTAEAFAELDEMCRSLEASTQSTETMESSGSQSSPARNPLESPPQSGPDTEGSSPISPSISESPSSNGHSYPSPDAPADGHRSASANPSDANVAHEWRFVPPPPAPLLPRAPPAGGRQAFIMPDVTVPPPNLPPMETRSRFGVAVNGGRQSQQRSPDGSELQRPVAPRVADAPRGFPLQRSPVCGQSPPQQWAERRSRSPLRGRPAAGMRFFPSPTNGYHNGPSRGRFFPHGQHVVDDANRNHRQPVPTEYFNRQSAAASNATNAPNEPPNILDGYGYVDDASPRAYATAHVQRPLRDRSSSPLQEGPAAKRPYLAAHNGHPRFPEHRGYRPPPQARARSCGPGGRQPEDRADRRRSEDRVHPRPDYAPSQNPSDRGRYEEPRRGRSPPPSDLRRSSGFGVQPEGPRRDRSQLPLRRWAPPSQDGPVAKRQYGGNGPSADHRFGENQDRSHDRRDASSGQAGGDDGRRRYQSNQGNVGTSSAADAQPDGDDGAPWWGPEGDAQHQNEDSSRRDGRRHIHESTENRQPNDGNRQHAPQSVGVAPVHAESPPEGPAPQPRARPSIFRQMNEEELMARTGGGPSYNEYAGSNGSADARPPRPALRQHEGRQMVPVLAHETTHPEGPSVTQQPNWRPANEVLVPVTDSRPSRPDFRGGFRKRSRSYCADDDLHRHDAGPHRRVRWDDSEMH